MPYFVYKMGDYFYVKKGGDTPEGPYTFKRAIERSNELALEAYKLMVKE